MKNTQKIATEKKRWEEEKLNKKPYPPAQTTSGIDLKVVYTPEDVGEQDYMETLGFPGEFPFTRGVYPSTLVLLTLKNLTNGINIFSKMAKQD